MITANLATYPPRRASLLPVVQAIAPQVDVLNVVLNQYDSVPAELAGLAKVNPVIPHEDTKDVGKFYVTPAEGLVMLIDDDLVYPADFVARTVAGFEAIAAPKALGGYHTSTYYVPRPWHSGGEFRKLMRFRRRTIADYRRIDIVYAALARHKIVDQVATNACIMRAGDFPGYAYMRDSQKFVDVRLAKWCFEKGILPVSLPRAADWIRPIDYEESIYSEFTRHNPPHVADEIWTYAFKVKGRRTAPPLRPRTD